MTEKTAAEAKSARKIERSCIDCMVGLCDEGKGNFPEFCRTTHLDGELLAEALAEYGAEENHRVAIAAADVEAEGYGIYPRAQEIVEFAKKLGCRKIGIATCVGLLREARAFARLLRHHGFEVTGVACKVGSTPKSAIGISDEDCGVGEFICNPILQAKILNEENVDLKVVIGLCVGHDSLFYKYADGIVTTLVTKDRVTGHNPCAVLYQLDSYYSKLLK